MMLLQICADYSGLGDFRKLETHEIEFFYNALKEDLKQSTKETSK